VLLSIDVQGAGTIRQHAESDPRLRRALISIFLTPPSIRTLEERLVRRGKDSPETIQRRLSAARAEIAHWSEYDYLIMSTSVSEDFERFQAIVRAEKMRVSRSSGPQVG
jgi:guanylate kinase